MAGMTPVESRETWGYALSPYTPNTDKVVIDVDIDFITRPITPTIHLVQYDKELPVLAVHMYENRSAYTIASVATAAIRINCGGEAYYHEAQGKSADGTTVYFEVDETLCLDPGYKPGVIEISNSQGVIGSSPIAVDVDQNPVPEDAIIASGDYVSLKEMIDQTRKWAYGDCQDLTNNSRVRVGKADATDVATNATAEGYNNTVSGVGAHAEGTNNTITSDGLASHAEGNFNTVSNSASHVEGYHSTASGSSGGAHAEGGYTTASAQCAHAEGFNNIASGAGAHAEGFGLTGTDGNQAIGSASHVEGMNNIARAGGSHAEGRENEITADGLYSHAEGSGNTVSGQHAHAEGNSNTVSGNYAHAGGTGCTASGAKSHASGENCTASGVNSFAHGLALSVPNDNMAAFGKYNTGTSGNLFEIGCGADSDNKRNALWVDSDGFVHLGVEAINTDSLMYLMRLTTPIILPPNPHGTTGQSQYHEKGKIDLTTETPIAAGASGVMTGTLTGVCPDTIYESCYGYQAIRYGKRFPKHDEHGPNYFPFFDTVYIKNIETDRPRKVLEVGTTYSFDNYDSSTNTFDLTVNTQVINLSSDTPINSNVVIRKSIRALCYPDMNQS